MIFSVNEPRSDFSLAFTSAKKRFKTGEIVFGSCLFEHNV